ncbi:MAG: hypothetical protein ACOX2S_02620 [bacterium]|jgi:hypothetical protein
MSYTHSRVDIKEELLRVAKEGKVSCAQAFELAKRLGVDPKEVGQAANQAKLKITACRLGCF